MQSSTARGITLTALLFIGTTLAGQTGARADDTPTAQDTTADATANQASAESVQKLIELTSGVALAEQMFSQLISVLREQHNMSQALVDELRAETDFGELLNKTIPIYQKHLTQEDVDAAIVFWSSPAGEKFTRAAPEISRDSFEIGQAWGRALADRAMARIKARKLK